MFRTLLKSVAGCALAMAATAQAAVINLTFEGLQNEEEILNFYNNGTGSLGSGPGPNYGITFGTDALALISDAAGGVGNFDGAPTMPTIAFFLSGSGDVMDVSGGFNTGFSFYYSSPFFSGSVSVYDGLDGTGKLLALLDLPSTPDGTSYGPPCSGNYNYCPWFPIGVSFSGTAESVIFSGTANQIGFDNITLGSSTPVGAPEPATIALLGLGLAGLTAARRRQARA